MPKIPNENSVSQLFEYKSKSNVTSSSFNQDVYILIHGFTSESSALYSLAGALSSYGYSCLLFNYNSLIGIQKPVDSLISILSKFSNNKFKINLIGHSMGGLVARKLAIDSKGYSFTINQLITLGTPHLGVNVGKHMLLNMTNYFKSFNRKVQRRSQSLLELTLNDHDRDEMFISKMNNHELSCELITISGGKNQLEPVEKAYVRILNKQLSKIYKQKPHDGLVLEESSNINSLGCQTRKTLHVTDYREFININHNDLIKHKEIPILINKSLNGQISLINKT